MWGRKNCRYWRRGKCTGALVHLCQYGLHTPIPGVFLSYVLSLCNKVDKLMLLAGKHGDFLVASTLWTCGCVILYLP